MNHLKAEVSKRDIVLELQRASPAHIIDASFLEMLLGCLMTFLGRSTYAVGRLFQCMVDSMAIRFDWGCEKRRFRKS